MRFTKLLKPRSKEDADVSPLWVWAIIIHYAFWAFLTLLTIPVVLHVFTKSSRWGLPIMVLLILTLTAGLAKAVTYSLAKDSEDLSPATLSAIQEFCHTWGIDAHVQVINDYGHVERSEGFCIEVAWINNDDGIEHEPFAIARARDLGIRGGDEVRYRRVYHQYPGLPLIMDSEKLIFTNSSRGEFLATRDFASTLPDEWLIRDRFNIPKVTDLRK